MKKELTKLMEKLVSPLERIELRYEQLAAFTADMPIVFRIFTKACSGFVTYLILSTYLFIVAILMSTLLVAFSLAKLRKVISKRATGLLDAARKRTSKFIQGLRVLLNLTKK